ncbi:hypothetical protein RND81_06G218300 [Saponaria officinalis]|uniref:Gamma-glutamylcyclotransferase family protein n=1 Tax=Saponaria officinalis TaxID=3572 RepID=A0AAW1K991_SAPOF
MSTTPTTTNDAETLIFVYGTLKRSFPNHHLLETFLATDDAKFLGVYKTVDPYPMVRGPLGVPFLINLPGSGLRVKGELYSVSGRALARLDELEGIGRGHYERLPAVVTAEDGGGEVSEVEAYYADRGFAEELWEKSGRNAVAEYLPSDAEKYVGVEARDVEFSLGDYIRVYLQQ